MKKPLLSYAQLGASIERHWAKTNHRPRAFSAIAANALRESALHRTFDLSSLARTVARVSALPAQVNMRNSFGDPPLTVFSNDRFNIELLVWLSPATDIHDHGFSGAFTTLLGTTLQCRYTFEVEENYRALLLTGKRHFVDAEFVRPGEVHEIGKGSKLIHAVWHLPSPSVSIVVRTHQESPNQYGYMSHCAANSFAQRRFLETDAVYNKRMALLASLCALGHPDRDSYIEELVARSTPFTLFHFLEQYLRASRNLQAGALRTVFRRATTTHPRFARAIEKSLTSRGELSGRIQWGAIRTEGSRFLLSLLLSVPTKRGIERLIREAYPNKDVEALVFDWTRDILASNAVKLSPRSLALLVSLAPSRLERGRAR